MRKRRREPSSSEAAAETTGKHPRSHHRFSIVTWNVDGLRALLRDDGGKRALQELLRERPLVLCLLEHKLQDGGESAAARAQLESIADEEGYDATWTFSPRAAD